MHGSDNIIRSTSNSPLYRRFGVSTGETPVIHLISIEFNVPAVVGEKPHICFMFSPKNIKTRLSQKEGFNRSRVDIRI